MVGQTAPPLKALGTKSAVDSSGLPACRFDRRYDAQYGRMHAGHSWVKVPIMTGVLTSRVTAVAIHGEDAADNPRLPPPVRATASGFEVGAVSGDKAYGAVDNYDAIRRAGGTPYIAFESDATGWSGGPRAEVHALFTSREDESLRHYHQGSDVESTFPMVERKFGDSARSKTDVAMGNEVLAKFVCRTIACRIRSAYEFGTGALFATGRELDSKMILKFPI